MIIRVADGKREALADTRWHKLVGEVIRDVTCVGDAAEGDAVGARLIKV